ncbi:hypothetical protein BGZ94_005804 [Podila epigama]|nr:hypothetical protein BGZ94_005804 [Podila epigama]
MLGFDGLKANLMTIPGHLLSLTVMLLLSYSSDKHNERTFHGVVATIYYACCIFALAALPIGVSKYSLYITLTFAMGAGGAWHPLNAAWIASNTSGAGKRTIALAMYIMCVNLTGIAGANMARAEHAPRFITSTWIMFGSLLLTIALFISHRFRLRRLNNKRAKITANWTEADWKNYNETTKDRGDDRLDFVYSY